MNPNTTLVVKDFLATTMQYLIKWVQDWKEEGLTDERKIRYALEILLIESAVSDGSFNTDNLEEAKIIEGLTDARMLSALERLFSLSDEEVEQTKNHIATRMRKWLSKVDPSGCSSIKSVSMALPKIHELVMEIKDPNALSKYLGHDKEQLKTALFKAVQEEAERQEKTMPNELIDMMFESLVDSVMVDELMRYNHGKKLEHRIIHHLWLEEKAQSSKQNTSAPRP